MNDFIFEALGNNFFVEQRKIEKSIKVYCFVL